MSRFARAGASATRPPRLCSLAPVADRTQTLLVLAREPGECCGGDRAEHFLEQVNTRGDRYADVHHLAAIAP